MKYVTILIISIFLLSCQNESTKQSKQNSTKNYPEGREGNYVILSDSLIEALKLTEKKLKQMQFYVADDLNMNLYGTSNVKDTQIVKTKSFHIKKFTPCLIIKKIPNPPRKWNKLLGVWMEEIERGYEVEFGDGLSLVYDPFFKFFTSVAKYKNKVNNYSGRFDENSSLLVEIKNPIMKYETEDTISVSGKRR